jgi:hypothetical protein
MRWPVDGRKLDSQKAVYVKNILTTEYRNGEHSIPSSYWGLPASILCLAAAVLTIFLYGLPCFYT